MFGSDVLDVAIGITLMFLFVSLICSAIQEAIEAALRWRAMDLERGIREIFQGSSRNTDQNKDSERGKGADSLDLALVKEFYDHPFIYSLFPGSYEADALKIGNWRSGARGRLIMPRAARSNLPTYIPSQNFSAALIDLIRQKAGADAPLTIDELKKGAALIENPRLKKAIIAAISAAEGKIERLQKIFESWYDGTMDRVSGWYKRRTQIILMIIGFTVAILFNIDAVNVARHLVNDKAYREAVVAQAERFSQAQAQSQTDTAKPREGAPPAKDPAPPETGKPQPESAAAKKAAPKSDVTAVATSGQRPSEFKEAQARAQQFHTELSANGFLLGWPAQQVKDARAQGGSVFWACIFMAFGWVITGLSVSFGAPFWFDLLNKFMVVRSTVKPAEKSGREGSKDSGA